MANDLTDDAERLVLDWIFGTSTVLPVLPMVCRLMATNGSESAAGTEVTGDSYQEAQITVGAAATVSGASSVANTVIVSFPIIDSVSSKAVNGYEIWDSGPVPRRFIWKAFGATVTVTAGENAQFAVGALVHSLE